MSKQVEDLFGPLGLRDQEGIEALMLETCQRAGMPEVYDLISWKFNSRLTTTLGHATYSYKEETGEVSLCYKLWGRASYEDRRNVIIHEVCHILVFRKYGYHESDKHGPKWKAMMRLCGGDPARCHSVDTKGVRRKVKRYHVECRCTRHNVSQNLVTRMRKGQHRKCKRCGYRLDIETASLIDWWKHE